MQWDTDYDTPTVLSSRSGGWPDAAQLAEALMGVPSLSDSLAAAQTTSPARKRKLFGTSGTLSPGRAAIKAAGCNNNGGNGRQLAGLPSSKRARMSHSHPLSRSSPSPPRQQSPFLRQTALRRSPSPGHPNATTSITNLPNFNHHAGRGSIASGTLTPDERTCKSCRRTATSLLQLAKFHKCSLCGGLSCPVCSRSCQVLEEIDDDAPRKAHQPCREDDSPDTSDLITAPTNGLANDNQASACGKPVCRGCSVESADGQVQCYRCHAAPPQ